MKIIYEHNHVVQFLDKTVETKTPAPMETIRGNMIPANVKFCDIVENQDDVKSNSLSSMDKWGSPIPFKMPFSQTTGPFKTLHNQVESIFRYQFGYVRCTKHNVSGRRSECVLFQRFGFKHKTRSYVTFKTKSASKVILGLQTKIGICGGTTEPIAASSGFNCTPSKRVHHFVLNR